MLVATSEEMRCADRLAIEHHHIPSLTLMENAGAGAFEILKKKFSDLRQKKIVVVAGKGSNAGDGFVVARHLRQSGVDAMALLVFPEQDILGDAAHNLIRFRQMGGRVNPFQAHFLQDADILVDAIFGTGLQRKVEEPVLSVIKAMNRSQKWVLSLDIASGLSGDTGLPLGIAVEADVTVAMGLPKLGSIFPAAADFTGDLEVADIGIPSKVYEELHLKIHWITREDVRPFFAPRPKNSHKGSYGHLLLIGGSAAKPGSILLSGRAALRAGSGLVTVALPESAFKKLSKNFLELMYAPMPTSKSGTLSRATWKELPALIRDKEAIAAGPGLGVTADTKKIVSSLLQSVSIPLVLDADALNALAHPKKWKPKAPTIITPHPGEMARLYGLSTATVQRKRLEIAALFARDHQVNVVLKGFRTICATPQGEIFINSTGNPGMATAGMGDVLTGVIGSLLSQGMSLDNAMIAGVWLHGRAGDRVAARLGDQGLLASDVIEEIPLAIREIKGE